MPQTARTNQGKAQASSIGEDFGTGIATGVEISYFRASWQSARGVDLTVDSDPDTSTILEDPVPLRGLFSDRLLEILLRFPDFAQCAGRQVFGVAELAVFQLRIHLGDLLVGCLAGIFHVFALGG